MAALPRVGLIVTGGTIDSVGTDRLDLAWYIEAGKRLNDGELLGRVPELKNIADIQEIPFRRLPSHALVDKDWLDLLRTIHSIFDDDQADGIVITHGTNTLEETAYFLNLDAEDRQAGGARWLDAAIFGDQRRRLSESGECHQGRGRSGLTRARLLGGDERHDLQRPRRDQELDLSGRCLPVARHGTAGLRRRRRQGRLLSPADTAAHGRHRVRRAHDGSACRASTWCCPTSVQTAR